MKTEISNCFISTLGKFTQHAVIERKNGALGGNWSNLIFFQARKKCRDACNLVDNYDEERPHKSLGYLSPLKYAEAYCRQTVRGNTLKLKRSVCRLNKKTWKTLTNRSNQNKKSLRQDCYKYNSLHLDLRNFVTYISANTKAGRNFMSDILQIISPLKTEIKKFDNVQGKSLATLHETINALSETANSFENLWAGGWGNTNYNYYHNPKNYDQVIQVNADYFYDIISQKHKVNIDNIESDVSKQLEPYKKFQHHLITELSVIRDNETFNNENELLKSIENFKWGLDPSDYVTLRRPNQIPIYDMRALTRGLETPPHIAVAAHFISLATKTFSVRNFEELVSRILRQVELKLSIKSIPDNYGYTGKILKDIFDNFHSFYTQLKNRYNNRQTIEIKDEYDVQDLLHCILKLHFEDVREEEYTPSYGGSSTRMDFLLKNENIVIEVKKTRERLSDKEIGEQLILDVAHYKNHPNCNLLKCFVYDPENRIKNPRGLENDLYKLSDDNLSVELFIRP